MSTPVASFLLDRGQATAMQLNPQSDDQRYKEHKRGGYSPNIETTAVPHHVVNFITHLLFAGTIATIRPRRANSSI